MMFGGKETNFLLKKEKEKKKGKRLHLIAHIDFDIYKALSLEINQKLKQPLRLWGISENPR